MSYSSLFGGQTKEAAVKMDTIGLMNVVDATTSSTNVPIAVKATDPVLEKARKIRNSESDISSFGTEAGKEVAALADTVLKQTTTGKMDEFGKGITDILSLSSSVNVGDLNISKNKGLIGGITSFFKKKKVEVMAQFEDTSKQIQRIADDLVSRQKDMYDKNKFLDQLYEKNMNEYHALGHSIQAAEVVVSEMKSEYENLKAQLSNSTDQFAIQQASEMEGRIKLWEKQVDRLKRMQHVALLTAPEIRGIQRGNVQMVQKFDDLINTTLPAWKKQLSMTIIALSQQDNVKLGNMIDDKTNEFFRKAADLNHDNAIAVAKAGERSNVDIETLEHMQNQLIASVREVKNIEEQGRLEREAASKKIGEMRETMKQEMLSWNASKG